MADQDTHTSRAEQRMLAVAKLKRAASLPRMKDGRRPPMHVEAVSEGEKAQSEEERVTGPGVDANATIVTKQVVGVQEAEETKDKSPEPDSDHAQFADKTTEGELEADTELEGRPLSPTTAFKKRRSRSRSRSRGSKDLKAKMKVPPSPAPLIAGDSSPDENAPFTAPSVVLSMNPQVISPVPHFPFLQQSRFLRSPTTASPEMSLFYPGTSPPTPLPTLEDLQRGLMRSNSAGAAAVGRRMAMHKLTGGTETYDPSPSPTPPPHSKLSRNNTVSGGERSAARMNMLSRLGTRITKEADADTASGAEDRGAPSPTPKKRRRRSRRASGSANVPNANLTVSDSDFNSTNPNTPALPSTPLPALLNQFAELRAQSITPNQLSSSHTHSSDNTSPPPLPIHIQASHEELERPEQTRRRSVLVEDPDEEDRDLPEQKPTILPGTPRHVFHTIDESMLQQPMEPPSNGSSSGSTPSGVGIPVYLSERASSRNQMFPSSPFSTPLKEKPLSDEEEEQVIYPATTARPRTPYGNMTDTYDREISWVASPVPEIRMPIDDEEYDEDADEDVEQEVEVQVEREEAETPSSNGFSPEAYDDTSPRASSSSKSVFAESENLPETNYQQTASSAAVPNLSQPPSLNEHESPQFYPTRLSVASKIQSIGDRSPLNVELSDWDERYLASDSPKRPEPSSTTTWDKIKTTFSRAGSSTGRRSRTNSIVNRERRDNTDSSISRESGASLISSKTDKGEGVASSSQPQAPPLMQTPSASASILSLSPHAPPRGSVSPIPPPSSADMSRYQNAKLFPFPGMLRLEEERRLKGLPSATASTPDVSMQQEEYQGQPSAYAYSSTPTQTPDVNRERKLSHQNSDTRLYTKYGTESNPGSPSPYNSESVEAMPPQNGTSYGLKLPTTIPQVKQWLSYNSKKKVTSPTSPAAGSVSFSPLPSIDSPVTPITNKKPSLSDIFNGKKGNDISDWEDLNGLQSNASIDVKQSMNMHLGNASQGGNPTESNEHEMGQSSKGRHLVSLDLAAGRVSPFKFPSDSTSLARLASPDPSTQSDYAAQTTSDSSSTPSSQYSLRIQQGALMLERLEENLARGFKSPMWSSAIDDPPRKLILSSPVLQVVNPNTVKDRFLFLFNDILVIAKPVTYDQDNLMDNFKLSLPDRKYTVKSVVQLRNLRFCPDRTDTPTKAAPLGQRNPLIRSFVSQFSKDTDHAITALFSKSNANVQENTVLLGQLLARTLELDKSHLGEYLSRKTSKTVLKSYLDSFGFAGLRVDVALRVFLQSVNVSRHSHPYGALEHLLDSFGSRWYEANAKFVAYDKDLAVRLVWAIAQLNERLHGGIADEPGPTDHIRRTVTSKEFLDAFRRYDARYLVPDELLQELYKSIYHERLCQALFSKGYGSLQDIPITIKRPLPTRLTYKTQSEPIVFRLPQADPLFTIELYGQDMEFDPPVLHFTRSSEASFRVMGRSLGSKTITMCRSGPNAIKYTGLPVSHTIVVERAFMRNTFQLAFLQAGNKRRYMFSVDDPIIRNEWATSLKRQIDSAPSAAGGSIASQSVKFHKAADDVAFKVLQDTLIQCGSPVNTHSLNGSVSTQNSGLGSHLTGSSAPFTPSPLHTRSKSRSRVYHRHGAGRNELDLARQSPHTSYDSNEYSPESSDQANSPEQHSDGVQWTARDLEIHCQQNSSISLVLSFLQVGAPESALSPQSF